MRKIAIIGLGTFGIRMLEEFSELTDEITIADTEVDLIEKYKPLAQKSVLLDSLSESQIRRAIPANIDVVVVDGLGKIEKSIIITSFLKTMNIKKIVVKARSDEHGRILGTVGATNIIYPDREAAKRIAPMLASPFLFNFMPISENFALAEIALTEKLIGKTLVEANLRRWHGLNVVAIRKKDSEDFNFIDDLNYSFEKDDILLISGSEDHIFAFTNKGYGSRKDKTSFFKGLFPKK